MDTYNQIRFCRDALKDDIVSATYSPAEIDHAKERLHRIKIIESHGVNDSESEDTIPLMNKSGFG